MTLLRRFIAGGMLLVGCVWLAAKFHLLAVPTAVVQTCAVAFYTLWWVGLVMDWRSRSGQSQKEPSPAQSVLGVVIGTGGMAVALTARHAQSAHDYILPLCIAILTAVLGVIAFRFASRHRFEIGEARFDTTGNGS